MKTLKFSIFFLVLVILLSACNQESGEEGSNGGGNETLTWGSASLGSQGYVIIEALASTANNYVDDFRNSTISTAGGAENIVLLNQEEIQMGQATSDVLYAATKGIEPFQEQTEFSQVFAYGYWSLPILVPMDSDIQSIEDLKGKRLNVGTTGGSSSIIANAVLGEEGYDIIDEINLEHLNYQEAADALNAGQIDASVLFHMAGNLVAAPFQELAQSMGLRPLEFDRNILETVTENNEGLSIETALEDTFDFYTEDVEAPGMTGMLVTSPDTDEDIVYELVKVLYENEEEVRNISPELNIFELDYAVEGLVKEYPVHPGAAKYFQEEGIWEDDMVISDD
ncbi:TAXI family TRAP transporter solute-binding subunit [Virgibacillus oceani]